jgi:hypothetical protein
VAAVGTVGLGVIDEVETMTADEARRASEAASRKADNELQRERRERKKRQELRDQELMTLLPDRLAKARESIIEATNKGLRAVRITDNSDARVIMESIHSQLVQDGYSVTHITGWSSEEYWGDFNAPCTVYRSWLEMEVSW